MNELEHFFTDKNTKYSPSDRELEVISLVAEGLSNEAIATKLYVAEKTVEHHLYNIYAKLSDRGVDFSGKIKRVFLATLYLNSRNTSTNTILITVCAWCDKYLGIKDGEGQTGVNYSICPECLAKEMEKIEREALQTKQV